MDVKFEFSLRYLFIIKNIRKNIQSKAENRKIVLELEKQYKKCLDDPTHFALMVKNLRLVIYYGEYLFSNEEYLGIDEKKYYKYLEDFFSSMLIKVNNDTDVMKTAAKVFGDVYKPNNILLQMAFVSGLYEMFENTTLHKNHIKICDYFNILNLTEDSRYMMYYMYYFKNKANDTKNKELHFCVMKQIIENVGERPSKYTRKINEAVRSKYEEIYPTIDGNNKYRNRKLKKLKK
jgi:hypothetical protein